jgi:hypothetical protein
VSVAPSAEKPLSDTALPVGKTSRKSEKKTTPQAQVYPLTLCNTSILQNDQMLSSVLSSLKPPIHPSLSALREIL